MLSLKHRFSYKFLINSCLLGVVHQEAGSDITNSIQGSYWGPHCLREGGQQDTGWGRGRNWGVLWLTPETPLDLYKSCRACLGQVAGPAYAHTQPVKGWSLPWKGEMCHSWAEPLPKGLRVEDCLAAGGIDRCFLPGR